MTDTGLELGPRAGKQSVDEFVDQNGDYYSAAFAKIQGTNGFAWTWNWMAAIFGPLWAALRGLDVNRL